MTITPDALRKLANDREIESIGHDKDITDALRQAADALEKPVSIAIRKDLQAKIDKLRKQGGWYAGGNWDHSIAAMIGEYIPGADAYAIGACAIDIAATYIETEKRRWVEMRKERDEARAQLANAKNVELWRHMPDAGKMVAKPVRVTLPPRRYLKDRTVNDDTFSDFSQGFDACLDEVEQYLKAAGLEVEQ